MSKESKIVKAKCKKTGQKFGLEVQKYGANYEVVNMVHFTEEEMNIVSTEIREPNLKSHENLKPCSKCGNRKVSGCSCFRKTIRCSKDMPYKLECLYCDQFEIDYTRGSGIGPYTEWAGLSNIPDAIKDSYGNPLGSQYDLAKDGSFVGYSIVVLFLCSDRTSNFNEPKKALEKKGFSVYVYDNISANDLKYKLRDDKTQLWIISDRVAKLNREHYDIIQEYLNSNHGVYIWGDNLPYYQDANAILRRAFNTEMYGDSYGDKVLGIQPRNGEAGIIANHPITTGIVNFYEGITIAEVYTKGILTPLIYGSNKKVVAAYYSKNNKRVIVDGGFTRLYYKWNSAGTDRYIVNAAAWLTNIEYFGYRQ